ncbi:MAG: phosphoribosylformylglycinamidine synthase subunit PurL [Actinomycetota bacterium]
MTLTADEFERIKVILGREPNEAELAMYSVMWSEHCSYKSSRIHLKNLPSHGPHVLVGPGEGAGVIRVDDIAVAIRLESHNHPSFVEPVQGAATGIGGVVRDVLSMGARPIALLDPLRFGPLPTEGRVEPEVAERNRFLVEGVVSGISSYGNCLGIPTVGGEVTFEDCYSGNPLVNVMCIGVASIDAIRSATAEGPGNKVLLLGSKTGRDGIGGVSVLASATFDEAAADKRPSVQVGDPFTEKLLIEACLEMMQAGLAVGVQDLGGAGLCCATSETAAKASTGMNIDLDQVPRREPNMQPFELLTSESQERMLVIVAPANVGAALAICEKWELNASVIGEVTDTGQLVVTQNGMVVADVPAASLGDGPLYDRPATKPAWIDVLQDEDVTSHPPTEMGKALLELISSPNIASKHWVWEQYDHQVMLGTVVKPGVDAAVLRLPGAKSRLAVTTDANARFCFLDPYLGAKHCVAEAYRNISALGATPVAITNCLNFGSPEREEVMWQFIEAVKAIGEACLVLGTPVTGGNVSFYNETGTTAIYPTPVIGMVGVLAEGIEPRPMGFMNEGDVVVCIGHTEAELGGSEYARTLLGKVAGRIPALDLGLEVARADVVRAAIAKGILSSCHDISEGGLAVALVEACVFAGKGATIHPENHLAAHEWLFSETASRYLVSLKEKDLDALGEVEMTVLGKVEGDTLVIEGILEVTVDELAGCYRDAFAKAMGYHAR